MDDIYLFVYGTLKKGKHNHGIISHCKYIGKCKLLYNHYVLKNGPLPYLCFQRRYLNDYTHVYGELYKVTQNDIEMLDKFEGHPNFYKRKLIPVHLLNDNSYVYYANTYLYPYELAIQYPTIQEY